MRTDIYGQQIYDEASLCDLFLTDTNRRIDNIITETKITFNDILDLENIPNCIEYVDSNCSIEEFDDRLQNNWYMPIEYQSMDIAKFVLDQCKNDNELQRAGQELLLFQERNMFTLLKYLKYLVDTMQNNNIVYGVGRGSSVASFVLFLLKVHRINSLYYDLPIEEFLR